MFNPTRPSIRYVTSKDGVRIAQWSLGEGDSTLVYLVGSPWNHIELWELDECRAWYERLAQNRTLVRYDNRGTGLSQREVSDFSLEAQISDLEAVVESLSLERFHLFAAADAGPVALSYAARFPDQVEGLILWCAWPNSAEVSLSPRIQAWRSLLDSDWQLMTDTCAHLALGWSGGEAGRLSAAQLRQSVSQEGMRAAFEFHDSFDASSRLTKVRAPTLVIHRTQIEWLPPAIGLNLAAEIANSEFVSLEGEYLAPYMGNQEQAAAVIERFLSAKPPSGARAASAPAQPASASLPPPNDLTEREAQVLVLVARGLTNREFAEQLVLSHRTVEHHLSNLYAKIGARHKAEATAFALTHNLV